MAHIAGKPEFSVSVVFASIGWIRVTPGAIPEFFCSMTIGRAATRDSIISDATNFGEAATYIQIVLASFMTLCAVEVRLYVFLMQSRFWRHSMAIGARATPYHSVMTCYVAARAIGVERPALSKFQLNRGEIPRRESRLI